MKNILKNIFTFRFQPNKATGLAIGLGLTVIALSFFLRLFWEETLLNIVVFTIVLDVGIKVILGFLLPLYYVLVIRGKGLDIFGITAKKWKSSLIINIVFAAFLIFQFTMEAAEKDETILFQKEAIIPILYIVVAGVFELVFIYGFLRNTFKDAFGLLPSILLTSLFYSFHHAGFQPEFGKLIFVGILYASVISITGNALTIFPFFWFVGATWDVLVNFGASEELQGLNILLRALLTATLMFISYLVITQKSIKHSDKGK